jgi:hypothetical protein
LEAGIACGAWVFVAVFVLRCNGFRVCGMTTPEMAKAAERNEMALERVRRGLGPLGPEQTFSVFVGTAHGVIGYEDLLVLWVAALLRIAELEQLL